MKAVTAVTRESAFLSDNIRTRAWGKQNAETPVPGLEPAES